MNETIRSRMIHVCFEVKKVVENLQSVAVVCTANLFLDKYKLHFISIRVNTINTCIHHHWHCHVNCGVRCVTILCHLHIR